MWRTNYTSLMSPMTFARNAFKIEIWLANIRFKPVKQTSIYSQVTLSRQRLAKALISSLLELDGMAYSALGHVWTAPFWQGLF
jgi:hypothetical protein